MEGVPGATPAEVVPVLLAVADWAGARGATLKRTGGSLGVSPGTRARSR